MRWLGSLTCVELTSILIPVSILSLGKMHESNSAPLPSVFFSYAIITHERATLFVDSAQVDDVVRNHLGPEVEIKPYDDFFPYLKGLADSLGLKEDVVRPIMRSYFSALTCLYSKFSLVTKQALQ